ncbi:MAG: hypothetical protein JWP21_2580, partial [Tardiphaga sp.]|nr:hypothetical protein [Tardiphaga sp.]
MKALASLALIAISAPADAADMALT